MKEFSVVSTSPLRLEGENKAAGKTRYADDFKLHREAFAIALYPPHPRAKILNLDCSAAEACPGVLAVITADDVTGSNCLFGRFPVLAEGEVKFSGDVVACLAAEDEDTARKAIKLIKVEYKPLPGIYSLEEAKAAREFPVHEDRPDNIMENTYFPQYAGDIDAGMAEADQLLEAEYQCPFAINGYIEPDCILASEDYITGGIVIYGCIQNVYSIRGSVCDALGLPSNQVRVVQTAIGGSFGGKNESAMVMASRAALLCRKIGRPVRIRWDRKDVFLAGVKRHPYHFSLKAGIDADGRISGWRNKIETIGGPYNNQAMFADWRIAVHSAGPYATKNVKTDVQAYYSNTPYAGAYRGFSAPQHCFAVESFIDELAMLAGKDPSEFRKFNFVKEGDKITSGQDVGPGGLILPLNELLEDVLKRGDYKKKKKEFDAYNAQGGRYRKGLGLAAGYRGCGLGGEGFDVGGARIILEKDGHLLIQSDMVEMGQGLRTSHAQVAAEALGISIDRIRMAETDTSSVPDAGPTVASRGLSAGGMGVLRAAESLRSQLLRGMEELWELPEGSVLLNNEIFSSTDGKLTMDFAEAVNKLTWTRGKAFSSQGWFNPGVVNIDPETGAGNCYPAYLSALSLTELKVDTYTGALKVCRVTMAYELGRAVNPGIVRSQLIGGYTQGLGYALCENFKTSEGKVETASFGSYLMPQAADMPEFDLKLFEKDFSTGPYGAKGIGEVGVELAAPGVGNALFHATGLRLRSLPFSMEKIAARLLSMEDSENGIL